MQVRKPAELGGYLPPASDLLFNRRFSGRAGAEGSYALCSGFIGFGVKCFICFQGLGRHLFVSGLGIEDAGFEV